MLRRPATVIQLTQADIEQYEANRQRKMWEHQQAQAQGQTQPSSQSTDTSDKTKEQAPPTNAVKSKKDRIMGGGGRGN